jgi:hypothetical protein
VTANGLPNRSVRYERTVMTRLGTDGDAILDIVEDVLWDHILCHQLTLHAIRAITHDPLGHILADPQCENQVGGGHLINIHQRDRRSRRLYQSADAAVAEADFEDALPPNDGAVDSERDEFEGSDRERSFISF